MNTAMGYVKSGLMALGLYGVLALPAAALPLLSLSASQAGSVVTVLVRATGVTDLYDYEFSLNFNPAVLQATTVTEGAFLGTGGATFFGNGTTDNGLGNVSFIFDTLLGPTSGVSGSGILAMINFGVRQSHMFTTLSLSDVLLGDSRGNDIASVIQAPLVLQTPEPGMLALLAIGLVALTLTARRKRKP